MFRSRARHVRCSLAAVPLAILLTVPLVLTAIFLTRSPAAAHPGLHEQQHAVRDALARAPEDPALHVREGRIHAEQRDWDAALASYARAVRLGADPDDVAVLVGALHLDAGAPEAARWSFEDVLDHEPQRADARLGRARAWMQLGRPDAAAPDFEAAVVAMEAPTPPYVLEWHRALLAAGAPERALAALDTGIVRLGPVPSLQLAAVDVAVLLGHHDDALQRLDRLLRLEPDHPRWLARRGEVLERAGRTEEARVAYRRALDVIDVRSARRPTRALDELGRTLRTALARCGEKTARGADARCAVDAVETSGCGRNTACGTDAERAADTGRSQVAACGVATAHGADTGGVRAAACSTDAERAADTGRGQVTACGIATVRGADTGGVQATACGVTTVRGADTGGAQATPCGVNTVRLENTRTSP
jgi:tetratricopeptide (TPR) repeat protein